MEYFDAHVHLQDKRLKPFLSKILEEMSINKISRVSVCGTCEEDWLDLEFLARSHDPIIPSFGVHPWYVKKVSPAWADKLNQLVHKYNCGIGEIGIDGWVKGIDMGLQEEIFVEQLKLACDYDLPVTIHCVRAWDRLLKILKSTGTPGSGFVVHSYGGLEKYIDPLAEMGAYFSFPGYFARKNKFEQRNSFKSVPIERLLIETDAPDQLPPPELDRFPLPGQDTKKALNNPLNIIPIYEFLSKFLNMPLKALADIVKSNFLTVFAKVIKNKAG